MFINRLKLHKNYRCLNSPLLLKQQKNYFSKQNKDINLKDFDYSSQKVNIDTKKLIEAYGLGPNNWGDLSYFRGDYINFGFWENIKLGNNDISVEDRIKSSKNLYCAVLKELGIKNTHTVLEAGCGRGMGIIDLLSQIPCNKILALDMNEGQLEKFKSILYEKKIALNIEFLNKNVYDTKLQDNSVDRIYSVEVAQHFEDMFSFAKEMKRILKKDGKIIFTTYFLKDPIHYQRLVKVLPHVEYNLDKLHLINDVQRDFNNAGFKSFSYKSIGEHVFFGYDKWLEQMNSNLWSRQFYQAFKQNIIDYYIIYVE